MRIWIVNIHATRDRNEKFHCKNLFARVASDTFHSRQPESEREKKWMFFFASHAKKLSEIHEMQFVDCHEFPDNRTVVEWVWSQLVKKAEK